MAVVTNEQKRGAMTKEELDALVAEEERRLGIGSEEFMKRHNEIMEEVDQIKEREEESRRMVAARVDKIVAAMVASCMSPQEIADRAGVSVNVVYRVRKGYLVKFERFGKVCRALGVDPEQYIDYSRLKESHDKP